MLFMTPTKDEIDYTILADQIIENHKSVVMNLEGAAISLIGDVINGNNTDKSVDNLLDAVKKSQEFRE